MQNQPPPTDSQLVTDSPIVERDRSHLNDQERALIGALLRPGASIEAAIPPDASADELWRTLDACVRGLGLLEARICRLKPIIGRILLAFENKPSLYKGLGYDTYSDFMNRGVYPKLGLHRTAAYEGKLVARDWPQLGPDRYVEIGPKKLNILSKFMKGSNSNAEQWLETAKSMKVTEFRQYTEQRGFIAVGETVGATIVIQTNQMVKKRYQEFFGDGRIQQVVGSKEQGRILEALMQECFDDWVEQYEEARRNKNALT